MTGSPFLPDALLLAELDGTQYLQLAAPVVLATISGEVLHYYCTGEAWEASPAAQEARRRARIAALETELAELKAAAPPKRRKTPVLPPPTDSPAPPPGGAPTLAPAPDPSATCPHCGLQARNRTGLAVHIAKRHKGQPLPPQPLLDPAPPPATPDRPGAPALELYVASSASGPYVCTRCAATAFAPSVGDPAICVRCDAALKRQAKSAAA